LALVKAAREAGIRIVAIDAMAVYESQHTVNSFSALYASKDVESVKRMQGMNYSSQAIMRREEGRKDIEHGKWIALMGNMHVGRQHDTPGVAEIFHVPAIYIFNKDEKAKPSVAYDVKRKIGDYVLKCDVCIDADRSAPAVCLQAAEKKELNHKI
jgi:hypothetical protein